MDYVTKAGRREDLTKTIDWQSFPHKLDVVFNLQQAKTINDDNIELAILGPKNNRELIKEIEGYENKALLQIHHYLGLHLEPTELQKFPEVAIAGKFKKEEFEKYKEKFDNIVGAAQKIVQQNMIINSNQRN